MEEHPTQPEVPTDMQEDHNFFQYKQINHFSNIPPNTIDDGVAQSVWRQFSSMAIKFSFVICPRKTTANKLRNWDLWGPFFMCCIFGLFINNATQFVVLFGAVFGGAVVVTFNTRILGGKISIFQSVSILGYCIFPLFFASVTLKLLAFAGFSHVVVKILALLAAAIWAVISAQLFIASSIDESKKLVSLYPILMFYLFIALMALYV